MAMFSLLATYRGLLSALLLLTEGAGAQMQPDFSERGQPVSMTLLKDNNTFVFLCLYHLCLYLSKQYTHKGIYSFLCFAH